MNDLEISKKAEMKDISEIAQSLGIDESELYRYGKYMAKIPLHVAKKAEEKSKGKLILVTAITPTPAGEGKTTTSIGLSQALNKLGKKSIVTLREPSLGPVFGVKGGAAGGGYSQVVPMEDINLHFTGDIHAVTAAHNLLSALIDSHIKNGNELNLNTSEIYWPRVMDMNDRSLRSIVVGLGGPSNGLPREDRFVITAASEVMAILCLSRDIEDLKERLGKIIIGKSREKKDITAKDLNANGAMAVLLKNAINPNLVQTLENTPALIHGGPFANIAHGTNSIVATRTAMSLCEYTVTEAGFAADLGAEKFFDVVSGIGGFSPDATVIVATVRALKMHGGVQKKDLDREDLAALESGIENLKVHIENLKKFNTGIVVALNVFPNDTEREINSVSQMAGKLGVRFAVSEVWAKGGEGGLDLARQVMEVVSEDLAPKKLYGEKEGLREKIEILIKEIYRAGKINYSPEAARKIKKYSQEYPTFPVIMAKTQASISDDPKKTGAPKGYEFTVRDLSVSAGAGFLVVYAGDIMTMPGLPVHPAAMDMDIDTDGNISGLF